ncbi:S8 family serine peptidase [Candidatus Woesearchaeota archaeon]|nr:S8 family serine peptidase [Candidatus Woesearchaeota archaeon]
MKTSTFIIFCILLSSVVIAGRVKDDLAKQLQVKGPEEKVSVIIQFDKKPAATELMELRAEAQTARIKHEYKIIDGIALDLPRKNIEKIARRLNVKIIEPDYDMEAFLDVSVPLIQAPNLWDKGIKGAGVKVAVLDTGIFDRPELTIVLRQDFTGEGPGDLNSHGTHVASTVGNKDLTFKGVAPDVQLMDGKVLGATGSGSTSGIIAAMDWAIANNADIISMSLGGTVSPCDGTDSLSLAVDNAVDRGKIVIVAAGNSGPDPATIKSPGCSKKAITVGASDDFDQIATFSSRGPTADGRVKPDIVAPGKSITALLNAATGTKIMSGTSMATPHVAGIAALIKSNNPALDQGTLLQALKSTAKNLGLDANTQGAGRVDALAAFNFINPCGDGVCSATETCVTCARDCGNCPVEVCGNGVCGTGEDSTNCPADCPPPEVCGNAICAGGETCSTCPGDCGACPPRCGNRRCETGETCKTCRFDCGKCPRGSGRVVSDLEAESGPDTADVALITLGALAIGVLVLAAMSAERKV